jgi:signal transduction histidine kinase
LSDGKNVAPSESHEAGSLRAGPRRFGVRGRLLLAFFGISGFAILAAVAGNYAFRQVGHRLELVVALIPQIIGSMEISRAVDRLMALEPGLLAASTAKERDEIVQRMQPEFDRLAAGLESVGRSRSANGAAAIQPLVNAFQSNLTKLESLVSLRLMTRKQLAGLVEQAFQADQSMQALFAPWLEVMEMQISRLLADSRKQAPGADSGAQAASELSASIAFERSAQAGQREFSDIVKQLMQTATTAEQSRLPVIEFQVNRGLADLDARAAELDPKLRALFTEQAARIRKLSIGPQSILAIRGQELGQIEDARKLIAENSKISAQLGSAAGHLLSDTEANIVSSAENAISLHRLNARILLVLAALSLIGAALITWLYVGRNLIRRLMLLNEGMLAIAAGKQYQPVDTSGTDEISQMAKVVEIFRKNTLERDTLLNERARAADDLERQVEERTSALARSVEELRALGEVTKAVNSTVDLEIVLDTIVTKATQLSSTDAGAIYVFDNAQQKFDLRATYGLPDSIVSQIRNSPIRFGQTVMSEAVDQRMPIQIPDVQEDPSATLDVIIRAGFRALLFVPLLGTDTAVGALIVRRKQPGKFSVATIELLQTFAAQSALAIQNASMFQKVQARTHELAQTLENLRTAQDRLLQTEKLASLGQLTAGIAHEIKNPLNFINNFAALSRELLDELNATLGSAVLDDRMHGDVTELTSTLKGNLAKVVEHGKRADSIVKNMLLHSREGSSEHRLAEVNSIVEESLNLAYHGARAERPGFNITLEKAFDPAAGQADLYPQEVTRVLLNLISNGFYATVKRGEKSNGSAYEPTLTATTRDLGDKVEIRIRDNGTGIPPEVEEKMFNPFFTTKPPGEGTGLGLSLSYDIIVKQHGGTIEIETAPDDFTEFRIRLPRRISATQRDGGER